MNSNINHIITFKVIPYFITGILIVFTIFAVIEIHDINAEMEQLKTALIELKNK